MTIAFRSMVVVCVTLSHAGCLAIKAAPALMPTTWPECRAWVLTDQPSAADTLKNATKLAGEARTKSDHAKSDLERLRKAGEQKTQELRNEVEKSEGAAADATALLAQASAKREDAEREADRARTVASSSRKAANEARSAAEKAATEPAWEFARVAQTDAAGAEERALGREVDVTTARQSERTANEAFQRANLALMNGRAELQKQIDANNSDPDLLAATTLAEERAKLAREFETKAEAARLVHSQDSQELAKCMTALRNKVAELGPDTLKDAGQAAHRRNLVEHYMAYKHLAGHYWSLIGPPPDLRETFGKLANTTHSALAREGLYQPISAVLLTGAVLSNSSGDLKGPAENSFDAGSLFKAVVETKHFGDESQGRFDVSAAAAVGLEPVRALFTDPSNGKRVALAAVPGFTWSGTGKLNWKIAQTGEIAGLFRFGQSTLSTANTTIVGPDGQPQTVVPIGNVGSSTGAFIEGGLEWNYFGRSLDMVHAEKDYLDSPLAFGLAYRSDRLLSKVGLNNFENLGGGQHRLLLRISLAPLEIATDPAKPADLVKFGFAVEYDRPFGRCSSCMPSITRIVLRGDLNLVKALGGSQ